MKLDEQVRLANKNNSELASALQNAGGSVGTIMKEDMSLEDFLVTCAINGIELTAKVIQRRES